MDGYYNCELDDTDTDTIGLLTIVAHHADALPVRLDFQVIEESIYDSLLANASGDLAAIKAKTDQLPEASHG